MELTKGCIISELADSDFNGFCLAHIVDYGDGYTLYIAAKGSRIPKSQRFIADVTEIVRGTQEGKYSIYTAAELICDVAHLAAFTKPHHRSSF